MNNRLAEITWVASCIILTGCSGHYSVLNPAGPHAQKIVVLWWAMLAVGTLVLLAICGLCWVAIRRNPAADDEPASQQLSRRLIVWGGIGLPSLCVTALLAVGIPVGHDILPWPDNRSLRINVHAKQWFWEVHYPQQGIFLIDEIYLPVNTPVDVHVTSDDVIHSFWIPRLGGKIDAIPGRTNIIRIQASQTGTFGGLCAEYCGLSHAFMKFEVTAQTKEEFKTWVSSQTGEDE